MKPVRTHTFNGRKYNIYAEDVDGWCDQFKCNVHELHILSDLGAKKGLETAIHESLHAENWAKKEKTVERTAREIAGLLWRLGYRKVK